MLTFPMRRTRSASSRRRDARRFPRRAPPSLDRRFAIVLLCLLLSGFAALLYQTAWVREFAFVLGRSELGVVSALAAHMAGLAVGERGPRASFQPPWSAPGSDEARVGLLWPRWQPVESGAAEERALAEPVGDSAAAVLAGRRSAARGDWDGLRALERRLATASPRDAVHRDAVRLRAMWRIASGGAERARAAVARLDEILELLPQDQAVARMRAALERVAR